MRGVCVQFNGFLIAIHCANHRLALCIKDANENAPWIASHDSFMAGAYSLCGKSPHNTLLFKDFCTELKVCHLSPKEQHAVRWSGRHFAVKQTFQCMLAWRALFTLLKANSNKERTRKKASALEITASTYSFVVQNAYLYDMCELFKLRYLLMFWRDDVDEAIAGG